MATQISSSIMMASVSGLPVRRDGPTLIVCPREATEEQRSTTAVGPCLTEEGSASGRVKVVAETETRGAPTVILTGLGPRSRSSARATFPNTRGAASCLDAAKTRAHRTERPQ